MSLQQKNLEEFARRFSANAVVKFIDKVDQKADQSRYIYRAAAPPRDVDDLRIEIVKGAFNRPVVSSIVDHLAAAPRANRKGATVLEGMIPATKIARDVHPNDLKRLLFAPSKPALVRAFGVIYDDLGYCTKAVVLREEYNFIQVITTGKISLSDPDAGLQGDVDYKIPSKGSDNRFKTLPDAEKFTNTSGDILTILRRESDIFEGQNGYYPNVALATPTVINDMLQNETIKKAIHGQSNSERLVTLAMLNSLLHQLELPVIIKYDVTYEDATGSRAYIMDKTKLVMLPGDVTVGNDGALVARLARLGSTDRGPTVEAMQSQLGNDYTWPEGRISGLFARSFIMNDNKGDGVTAGATYAVASTIPNLERADEVRIITVRSA